MTRTYHSAGAFKNALEQRLRDAQSTGIDLARRRQLIVFDRLLARICAEMADAVILKGGMALELRIDSARSTKDIDLHVKGSPDEMLSRLQAAARRSLGDFMQFEVQRDQNNPNIRNDITPYDGVRFRAKCTLAGKIYGRPFGVDVAFGDPMLGEPQSRRGPDLLGFSGIEPTVLRIYPIETHLAEKFHAYTMPRPHPNSRIKDLPDIVLIAASEAMEATRIQAAIRLTFNFRDTHAIPDRLPPPPESWSAPYEQMARIDQLRWSSLGDVYEAAQSFVDPVLRGEHDRSWDPESWVWR